MSRRLFTTPTGAPPLPIKHVEELTESEKLVFFMLADIVSHINIDTQKISSLPKVAQPQDLGFEAVSICHAPKTHVFDLLDVYSK